MNLFKKINLTVLSVAICILLFNGSADATRVAEGKGPSLTLPHLQCFSPQGSFDPTNQELDLVDGAAGSWGRMCRRISSVGRFMRRHTIVRKMLMIGILGLVACGGAVERGGFSLENARLFGASVGLVGGLFLDWAYGKYKRWQVVDVDEIRGMIERYA